MDKNMHRRTVVTTLGAGLVSAGGCLGLESESNSAQESTSSPTEETESDPDRESTSSPGEETEETAEMGSRDYADVEFFNHTSETLTVTLRATADGEEVVETTLSVPTSDSSLEDQTYEEFSGQKTLTVHVAVEDGPSGSGEFEDSKTDSRTLHVRLYPESIEFQMNGA